MLRSAIWLAGARRNAQTAAQRVAVFHGFQGNQPCVATACLGGAPHGGKGQRGHRPQAQLLRLLHECLQLTVITGHHHIAAQQLTRIALQSSLQPIGKKCHRSQCRYRQRNRHPQQAQFTGPGITPQ